MYTNEWQYYTNDSWRIPIVYFLQGAPESILERCTAVRVNGTDKVNMTEEIKEQIMEVIHRYGTGKGGGGVSQSGVFYIMLTTALYSDLVVRSSVPMLPLTSDWVQWVGGGVTVRSPCIHYTVFCPEI